MEGTPFVGTKRSQRCIGCVRRGGAASVLLCRHSAPKGAATKECKSGWGPRGDGQEALPVPVRGPHERLLRVRDHCQVPLHLLYRVQAAASTRTGGVSADEEGVAGPLAYRALQTR